MFVRVDLLVDVGIGWKSPKLNINICFKHTSNIVFGSNCNFFNLAKQQDNFYSNHTEPF